MARLRTLVLRRPVTSIHLSRPETEHPPLLDGRWVLSHREQRVRRGGARPKTATTTTSTIQNHTDRHGPPFPQSLSSQSSPPSTSLYSSSSPKTSRCRPRRLERVHASSGTPLALWQQPRPPSRPKERKEGGRYVSGRTRVTTVSDVAERRKASVRSLAKTTVSHIDDVAATNERRRRRRRRVRLPPLSSSSQRSPPSASLYSSSSPKTSRRRV